MDVAMGLIQRDSMTGKEAVRAANDATDKGEKETDATRALTKAIRDGDDLSKLEGLNQNNPTQNVAQMEASQKVHGALNATVPTLARAVASGINPAFGLVWGAADAAANKNLPGFAGTAAGRYAASALGIPALGGIFGELGNSLATGKSPDLGKAAIGTLGGYIGGRIGQEVGQAAGPIAGTVAGSLAKNATNFGAAKALGL